MVYQRTSSDIFSEHLRIQGPIISGFSQLQKRGKETCSGTIQPLKSPCEAHDNRTSVGNGG